MKETGTPGSDAAGRPEILGLIPAETRRLLSDFLRERNAPSYRLEQIVNWVYRRFATGFEEMTTLPARLRRELAEGLSLTPIEAARTVRSRDGTLKHLWRLNDGEQVESVLIPAGKRVTLCLSSQAGCALGCTFCATGYFGFRRQLRSAEIVAQFRSARRAARAGVGRPVSHVVYMGMGEPLANLDAVVTSLQVLHQGFGLGARRITVSTVGIIPGIRALAARPEPFRLAVSLHAPNHALRLRLVPVERRYPLPELLEALRAYQAVKGRRLTFEYTLIDGINDSEELAEELADTTTGLDAFVNLIPFNPIPDRDWRPSPPGRIRAFAEVLERRGVPRAVRRPRGRDIAAACGQLRLDAVPPRAEGSGGQPPRADGSRVGPEAAAAPAGRSSADGSSLETAATGASDRATRTSYAHRAARGRRAAPTSRPPE